MSNSMSMQSMHLCRLRSDQQTGNKDGLDSVNMGATCMASSRSRSCMTQFWAKVHQLPGSCAAASRCSIVSTCSTITPNSHNDSSFP